MGYSVYATSKAKHVEVHKMIPSVTIYFIECFGIKRGPQRCLCKKFIEEVVC